MNSYPEELGAVHISFDMCNYFRLLVVDGHMTFVRVVNEELNVKHVSKGGQGNVNTCFHRRAYI